MKTRLLLILLPAVLLACKQQTDGTVALEDRIDSLETKLADAYLPGFGEFMGYIQVHHAKLWFAGRNENWALAGFELDEIMETMENIRKYETGRKESKLIGMIDPALAKVKDVIEKKDPALFKSSYTLLTNTCNSCHKSTDYGFNVVKIPETPPFSNQDFRKTD
jgi:hypothetical protein